VEVDVNGKTKKEQKNERRSPDAGFKIFKDPEMDWKDLLKN
jgi:hypothetical protein